MLFTLHLLPLLRAAPAPRVLTVLAGSMLSSGGGRGGLLLDDLNLEGPGAFGGVRTQTHMGAMNTLFLDRLSAEPGNEAVTFVHNWPGAVNTGNMTRYHAPSFWSPAPLTVLLRPLFLVVGFGEKEAGERHAFGSCLFEFTTPPFLEASPGIGAGFRGRGCGSVKLVKSWSNPTKLGLLGQLYADLVSSEPSDVGVHSFDPVVSEHELTC
ncbi:hypothetical protein LZ30DRAFT_690079 [Colletotrichum cereale]|nr:hypothetical protein LZ30DRAFT_690079 [Colletotrichum cereale]